MSNSECADNHLIIRYDSNQKVYVETDDGDRFFTTAKRVADVLKINNLDRFADFKRQFKKLDVEINKWLNNLGGKFKSASLSTRDHGLILFVVPTEFRYDPEFEDLLSDFDLMIANREDLDLIQLSVMSLPSDSKEALACFVPPHSK